MIGLCLVRASNQLVLKRIHNLSLIIWYPYSLAPNEDIERTVATIQRFLTTSKSFNQNPGMKSPPRPLTQFNCESIDEVLFMLICQRL